MEIYDLTLETWMQLSYNKQTQIKPTCGNTEKESSRTMKLTNVLNNIMMDCCMDTLE